MECVTEALEMVLLEEGGKVKEMKKEFGDEGMEEGGERQGETGASEVEEEERVEEEEEEEGRKEELDDLIGRSDSTESSHARRYDVIRRRKESR